MSDGWSEADILGNYPAVTHDDIIACLAYARDTFRSEKVFPSAAAGNELKPEQKGSGGDTKPKPGNTSMP